MNSDKSSLRSPLKASERNAAMFVEIHPFSFQTQSLQFIEGASSGTAAYFPPRVHYTMPRDGNMDAHRTQGVTHEARLAGYTGQARNLAIGRYALRRNARDN